MAKNFRMLVVISKTSQQVRQESGVAYLKAPKSFHRARTVVLPTTTVWLAFNMVMSAAAVARAVNTRRMKLRQWWARCALLGSPSYWPAPAPFEYTGALFVPYGSLTGTADILSESFPQSYRPIEDWSIIFSWRPSCPVDYKHSTSTILRNPSWKLKIQALKQDVKFTKRTSHRMTTYNQFQKAKVGCRTRPRGSPNTITSVQYLGQQM